MLNKKCWAEKFQQALENKDSLERYAIDINWWNDFKSQLMIVMEVYDFEMEGGDLLGSDYRFDNSKLIKEGDYEERKNLIIKMKELNKESIKTMQDYFMINPQLIVNKEFCLIGGEAYDMLVELNNGGPSIRLFVDEIKKDTELQDKVITGFMEGNDNLNENQFIDLDTIQLGIIIKFQDRTIIEVGYYPKNKSLVNILKIITKRMNIDYSTMVVDLRKSSTQFRKENQEQFEKDQQLLKDGNESNFFFFNQADERQNNTISQFGIEENQMIIFTDEYYSCNRNDNELWLGGADMMNFTDGGFNQLYNQAFQYNNNEYNQQEPFKNSSNKKASLADKRGVDFNNKFTNINIVNNRNINLNIINSDNNVCGRCSNATLESTYDSPTQIHNNSVDGIDIDDEGDDEDDNLNGGNHGLGQLKKRNILKRNKISEDSTEENDSDEENNHNQETEGFNDTPYTQQQGQQVPRQVIGQAKSQEEIDQIKQEINNSIGKSGTLQMNRLPNQLIIQNMIQMTNEMTNSIQEQLQQRAKQDKNCFQQLEKQRQLKDFSNQKGDDSERTSSTSTQPENIKKKKRKISSNILFDEPNIIEDEESGQFNN